MGGIMNIKYQIIVGIVVLVTCSFILMKVTNNNEPELELTVEQQQCEHEWTLVDVDLWLDDDYYIYCPKCELEDVVTYKEWNKIRVDQNYEEQEELRELME